ncbi:MAG: sigma 54-interacting transcriptional regulator, partial [candidate division Zixibacteria bacterium]|nr:sigma 54-interacting transcriptional regulator [candidate division Zixibacteria bacterium]
MKKHKDIDNAFCDSVAAYLHTLLDRRDFVGAISYFESNQSLVDEVGGPWAGGLLHQVARSYASLSNYTAALRAIRKSQALIAREGDTLQLAEVFLTLAGILRNSGELTEAERAFRDAESIFRRNDCPEGQSRALNQLAGIYFKRTEYRQALAVLMDAVGIASKLDDKQKLAYMMGNIGRLHTFMGDLNQAEKNLRINIDLSTELNDELEVVRARLSLAYIFIQRADYADAEKELAAAYPLIVALKAKREEVMYLTYLGELLYRTSEFENSGIALDRALVLAEQIAPDSTLAAGVMRQLAELALRAGTGRTASMFAARAMAILEGSESKVDRGVLLRIKAQLAARRRQPAEARKLFARAIDLLDESGVRWEMAEALCAAGSSPVFTERQRMTYLFRAEEFYSRNRLRNKLEPVSRQIGELGALPPAPREKVVSKSSVDRTAEYITACPAIQKIKTQLPILGRSDLPVLITGETGVGKDHMARYYHTLVRPDGPYVAINCASVPETLLESELFGYRKGAFTGAGANKKGLFVAADGGVLLLDEIGDMPLSLQAKLLGVLEQRRVLPLGGTTEIEIDIKLVAATNKNLEEMVEQGTFRRDLYYRLSGITFDLPPLRERKEDIPLLVDYFLSRRNLESLAHRMPSEIMRQFIDHDWPGNIRELDNKIKRLEIMAQLAAEGDLAEIARTIFGAAAPNETTGSLFDRMEQFERQLITEALLAARGNKSEAARMLGVHEATVRTKLKRW